MIGSKLAHYEILSKLGEGGMGEVWKARDTVLSREVAIKILPELFAQDAERRGRFEREARVLAQLNHPGIAAVHGLHEEDGRYFLAMELVPGEDLAHRLESGPLPVDEALKVGARVAEALEAAHEQSVIHRDLKPSNIVLMPGGAAKVLDFGLAKTIESTTGGESSFLASPTVTSQGTQHGVILGTAAYMSPEQSRGKPLDRRTDIWSFGCVLYECLTGNALFRGETVSDTIGAILHKEPDWDALPAGTPAPVVLLLKRCLTRDPDARLRDIGDARIEITQALQDPTGSYLGLAVGDVATATPVSARSSRMLLGAVLCIIGIGLGFAAGPLLRPAPEPSPLRKLDLGVSIEPSAAQTVDGVAAQISPDGRKVVFSHRDLLWVQFLNEMEPHPLEGTEGAHGPTWSPDGAQIAYFKGTKLWRIAATGGRSTIVTDLGRTTASGFGAHWGTDDRIVYSRGNTGIFSVASLGGQPGDLLPLQDGDGDFHEPSLLRGEEGILFVQHPDAAPPNILCVVRPGEPRKTLFQGEDSERVWHPVHAPSGHVLFRRSSGTAANGIWALPFDAAALEASGEAFLVAPDGSSPSVSNDGTLTFVSGFATQFGNEQFYWADRTGRLLEPVGDTRNLGNDFCFSPDGRLLAFTLRDQETNNVDLWVRDMERGTETRVTNNEGRFEVDMVWDHDGRHLFYATFVPGITVGSFEISRSPADGSAPPVRIARGSPCDVTPDGTGLILTRFLDADSVALSNDIKSDLARIPIDGSGEAEPVLKGSDVQTFNGRISPNGDLIVYESSAPGRREVFLSRYPQGTGRWQVSINGGEEPRWDPRGDRLYYHEGTKVMEVAVARAGDDVRLTRPEFLFELASQDFTPSPDGGRFLVIAEPQETTQDKVETRIGVKLVADWVREFEKR